MTTALRPLSEVNHQAIRLLAEHIGVVDTFRFVNQFTTGHGDYTQERAALFDHLTLDDIVSAIEKRRVSNSASKVENSLERMRGIEENWDGYGAAPPLSSAIDLARELVRLIEQMLQQQKVAPDLHVSPTRAGGVLIEWQNTSSEHEIEIGPDGSISFLRRQRATGKIETRRFTPEQGVDAFRHELRQLLAA